MKCESDESKFAYNGTYRKMTQREQELSRKQKMKGIWKGEKRKILWSRELIQGNQNLVNEWMLSPSDFDAVD